MRARHFRAGPAWAVRVPVEAPAEDISAPEPDMPRGQMIHLLEVRNGGPDSLFAKVLAYLKAVGSDDPSAFDRTQLHEAHLIRWNEVTQRDELLPPGRDAAEKIARQVARECGVHHITFHFKLPRSNTGSFASCSCGGWSQTVGRKSGDDDRLRRYAADHLDAVTRGTWKRQRPIQDFLNEIMPLPQLPFSGPAVPARPAKAARPDPGAERASVAAAVPGRN